MVITVVRFAGFCLYNDAANMLWTSVTFLPTLLEIRFVKRKNDQHIPGGGVCIASLDGASLCDDSLLSIYKKEWQCIVLVTDSYFLDFAASPYATRASPHAHPSLPP
jgi:hypothetical protein